LELPKKLSWRGLSFSKYLFAQLLANFFFHWFQDAFIFLYGSAPSRSLVFIGVETVYFSERIERRRHLESVTFFLGKKSQQFVVLGSQLEDRTNADDDILKIRVVEGLAIPLVLLRLAFPEFSRHFSNAIFPASADAHALVQLDADV